HVCLYVEDFTGEDLDCSSSVQRRAQGSKDLVSEESTNTSFGVVWEATQDLTFTLDFWQIEKEDTIGLFGEENHTILDLLFRLQAGTANCAGAVFNEDVLREDPDAGDAQFFLDAGVCPAGEVFAVEDIYANLDTRTIEGYDLGIYYGKDTRFGQFDFRYVGTFYDKYEQKAGGNAAVLIEAVGSGELPSNTAVQGFADLLGVDGNADEKHNASLRWSKDAWGAGLTMFRLGSFYDSANTLSDGTRYILGSMTTYNAYFDYNFDVFNADSRIRLGINNLTDERAPLADKSFNYWSDAHRDLGQYWYVDLRMGF
ncbi:MAG: TonB-dependent receptor, partial [Gammaproteobacteria bacterium]|nr:TonB-dependent receptor [Gammaproteobacteria bacterium]